MIQLLNQLPNAQRADFFSTANWQAVHALADCLPPLSGGGVEVHLNAEVPRSDFMIRATSTDHGREVLAGLHTDWHIPQAWLQNDNWKKIQNFSKQWAEPSNPLFTAVENVWLEFDFPPDGSKLSAPSIFFDLDRHRRLPDRERHSILHLALAAFNHELPDDFPATLQAISNKGPGGSFLYYAGLMLSRSGPAVRICLAGLNADNILPFLHGINCGEHALSFKALLERYAQPADRLVLHLDISSMIGRNVGIEIFKAQNAWPELFRRMAAASLCTRDEARKIVDWRDDLPLTNDHFRASVSRILHRDITRLVKRINHIKFVSSTGKGVAVKAYLYFGYY